MHGGILFSQPLFWAVWTVTDIIDIHSQLSVAHRDSSLCPSFLYANWAEPFGSALEWSQQDSNLWTHRCERCALPRRPMYMTILGRFHPFWHHTLQIPTNRICCQHYTTVARRHAIGIPWPALLVAPFLTARISFCKPSRQMPGVVVNPNCSIQLLSFCNRLRHFLYNHICALLYW